MSSTTQPKDFSDLYTDLINRVRDSTSQTTTVTQAKRYINTALQDMHIGYGERFPWAERKARLTTQPPYSTGTVTITKGATALTGAATAWTTTNSFGVANARNTGKIVLQGDPTIYEISSVDSATGITLASRFVGESIAAGTYSYFEDEYDLDADFLRPLDATFFDDERAITITDRTTFRRKYPRNSITGKPMVACIVDRAFSGNTTPIRRVAFWKPPAQAYSVPYTFVTNKLATSSLGVAAQSLSADADEPIVPFQYRHLIVLHALYNWYRDKKDDSRSRDVKAEFTDLMLRVTGDTEVGERRPVIQPRMGNYRNRARAPYNGRSASRGRWTTGTSFDEMG